MKNNQNPNTIKYFAAIGLVFVSFALLFAGYWIEPHTVEELLFYLSVPSNGANNQVITRGFMYGIPLAFFETLIVFFISCPFYKKSVKVTLKNGKKLQLLPVRFLSKNMLKCSVCFLCVAAIIATCLTGLPKYLYRRAQTSTVFEDYYVETKAENITFPEKKKNLVYIVLESMETDYADRQNGGEFDVSRIEQLTLLAEQNISFSHTSGFGGAAAAPYTEWTTAAIVAQTSGLPLKTSYLGKNSDALMDDVTALGDILEYQGYEQTFMLGSEFEYGARDLYINSHGKQNIFDYSHAVENGLIPEGYNAFWGYEDARLFEYAKNELTRLSTLGDPFCLTLLTVDTHFFDGYNCERCSNDFSDSYSNAIACSDKQVSEFVDWIKTQSFFEDTVIVICGDHPTMDPWYLPAGSDIDGRPIYNCIINSSKTAANTKNRDFTLMDMFPTVLSALGAEFEGDRLGLGTDLFSSAPTLSEQLTREKFFNELYKKSEYFDKYLSGRE